MLFNKDDVALILSALQYDRVGTWGDGREEKIHTLIMKIKRKDKNMLNDLAPIIAIVFGVIAMLFIVSML